MTRCGKTIRIQQEYEKAKADGKKVLLADKEQLEKELLGAETPYDKLYKKLENKGCIIVNIQTNIQSITDLQEKWNTILDELNELSADRDKQQKRSFICSVIQECYMNFPEETGHLKKSTPRSQIDSLIEGRWINEKIEELRKLGYSDEAINKKLGHLVNWRI